MVLARQPKFEAIMSEIEIVINELQYAIANMASWMQPEYVSKSLVGLTMGVVYIFICIIGFNNYF